MKAIIAAGGEGTRLHPMTQAVPKSLIPVAGKPMIYYPLSLLIESGFTEIMIITATDNLYQFSRLLGNGAVWGISITYTTQEHAEGVAQCLILSESFIDCDSVTLLLGDNIFWGPDLDKLISEAASSRSGATVFAYEVQDPENFGIVTFGPDGRAAALEEKPSLPQSKYCVPGLYCYDNTVMDHVKSITKSARGEFEITDVNLAYLRRNRLSVTVLDSRYVWHDTGTYEAVLQAEHSIRSIEQQTGTLVGSPELAAFRKGHIDSGQLRKRGEAMKKTSYGQRLIACSANIGCSSRYRA